MAPNDKREPMKDCFAYKAGSNTCNALTELMCTYKKCPFYKHHSEVNFADINRK